MYRYLADAVVVVHFIFVLFVFFGGALLFRRKWTAWLHLPAALWGTAIEFTGWICPLTPLENRLRALSGADGYETGFVAHYIMPVLYPAGLTREIQLVLGGLVLAVNVGFYGSAWWYYRKKRRIRRSEDSLQEGG